MMAFSEGDNTVSYSSNEEKSQNTQRVHGKIENEMEESRITEETNQVIDTLGCTNEPEETTGGENYKLMQNINEVSCNEINPNEDGFKGKCTKVMTEKNKMNENKKVQNHDVMMEHREQERGEQEKQCPIIKDDPMCSSDIQPTNNDSCIAQSVNNDSSVTNNKGNKMTEESVNVVGATHGEMIEENPCQVSNEAMNIAYTQYNNTNPATYGYVSNYPYTYNCNYGYGTTTDKQDNKSYEAAASCYNGKMFNGTYQEVPYDMRYNYNIMNSVSAYYPYGNYYFNGNPGLYCQSQYIPMNAGAQPTNVMYPQDGAPNRMRKNKKIGLDKKKKKSNKNGGNTVSTYDELKKRVIEITKRENMLNDEYLLYCMRNKIKLSLDIISKHEYIAPLINEHTIDVLANVLKDLNQGSTTTDNSANEGMHTEKKGEENVKREDCVEAEEEKVTTNEVKKHPVNTEKTEVEGEKKEDGIEGNAVHEQMKTQVTQNVELDETFVYQMNNKRNVIIIRDIYSYHISKIKGFVYHCPGVYASDVMDIRTDVNNTIFITLKNDKKTEMLAQYLKTKSVEGTPLSVRIKSTHKLENIIERTVRDGKVSSVVPNSVMLNPLTTTGGFMDGSVISAPSPVKVEEEMNAEKAVTETTPITEGEKKERTTEVTPEATGITGEEGAVECSRTENDKEEIAEKNKTIGTTSSVDATFNNTLNMTSVNQNMPVNTMNSTNAGVTNVNQNNLNCMIPTNGTSMNNIQNSNTQFGMMFYLNYDQMNQCNIQNLCMYPSYDSTAYINTNQNNGGYDSMMNYYGYPVNHSMYQYYMQMQTGDASSMYNQVYGVNNNLNSMSGANGTMLSGTSGMNNALTNETNHMSGVSGEGKNGRAHTQHRGMKYGRGDMNMKGKDYYSNTSSHYYNYNYNMNYRRNNSSTYAFSGHGNNNNNNMNNNFLHWHKEDTKGIMEENMMIDKYASSKYSGSNIGNNTNSGITKNESKTVGATTTTSTKSNSSNKGNGVSSEGKGSAITENEQKEESNGKNALDSGNRIENAGNENNGYGRNNNSRRNQGMSKNGKNRRIETNARKDFFSNKKEVTMGERKWKVFTNNRNGKTEEDKSRMDPSLSIERRKNKEEEDKRGIINEKAGDHHYNRKDSFLTKKNEHINRDNKKDFFARMSYVQNVSRRSYRNTSTKEKAAMGPSSKSKFNTSNNNNNMNSATNNKMDNANNNMNTNKIETINTTNNKIDKNNNNVNNANNNSNNTSPNNNKMNNNSNNNKMNNKNNNNETNNNINKNSSENSNNKNSNKSKKEDNGVLNGDINVNIKDDNEKETTQANNNVQKYSLESLVNTCNDMEDAKPPECIDQLMKENVPIFRKRSDQFCWKLNVC